MITARHSADNWLAVASGMHTTRAARSLYQMSHSNSPRSVYRWWHVLSFEQHKR